MNGYERINVRILAEIGIDYYLPLKILWHDGRSFVITNHGNIVKQARTKTGSCAECYHVMVRGQWKMLYRDSIGWFIEKKKDPGNGH